MDQPSGTTTSTETPTPAQEEDGQPATPVGAGESPGFGSRGRARRRARFLRKARELAYRDLGGLVFNLHRFGQRNDALVLAKLITLGHIDSELRTLEAALGDREPVTVLREAGITACPRCAAIHSSEDRFCPNCGLPMSRHVDLPVASAAAVASPPAPPSQQPQPHPGTPPPSTPAPQPPIAPLPTTAAPPAAATHSPIAAHPPLPAEQPASTPPGRSPEPPRAAAREEATEIIRPGAPGS